MEVFEGGRAVAALGQDAVVEGDRGLERVAQALAPGILARRALADLHAGPAGETTERLGKVNAVAFHDEVEDVAAPAAAEALPALAAGRDGERRCLLTVERAQPLERGTGLSKLD